MKAHLADHGGITPALTRERLVHENLRLEVVHKVIQPFLMLGLGQAGQMGVEGGDGGALVSHVDLDLAQVFTLLQQMGP
jgi:hypothetical protein